MTKSQKLKCDIVTEPVRLAFPHLFKASPRFQGADKMTFQATALLPPDFDLAPLKTCIKNAMKSEWGELRQFVGDGANPIKDAGEKSEYDGYDKGWHFINLHSGADYPPSVVDQTLEPIIDAGKVYAGCWVRFYLKAFAWEKKGGKQGVSFSLESVLFVQEGDRLDGRQSAATTFAAVAKIDAGTVPDATAPVGTDEVDPFG